MSKRIKFILLILLVLFISVSCDQVTKQMARDSLKGEGRIPVLGNFLVFDYAENNGAFLGMASGLKQPWRFVLLTMMPLILLLFIPVYILHQVEQVTLFQVFALALIVGGGIGNMIDRVLHNGWVSDFMIFGIGPLRTGIVNIADICITFGAIALLLNEVWAGILKRRRSRQAAS